MEARRGANDDRVSSNEDGIKEGIAKVTTLRTRRLCKSMVWLLLTLESSSSTFIIPIRSS